MINKTINKIILEYHSNEMIDQLKAIDWFMEEIQGRCKEWNKVDMH